MGFTGYSMIGLGVALFAALGWAAVQGARLDARDEQLKARAATITRLEGDLAQAKLTNDGNLSAIAALTAQATIAGEIAAKYQTRAHELSVRLNAALEDIANAPAHDDGPVAPVLARQLDRMRVRPAGPAGADAPPGRASASPGR